MIGPISWHHLNKYPAFLGYYKSTGLVDQKKLRLVTLAGSTMGELASYASITEKAFEQAKALLADDGTPPHPSNIRAECSGSPSYLRHIYDTP